MAILKQLRTVLSAKVSPDALKSCYNRYHGLVFWLVGLAFCLIYGVMMISPLEQIHDGLLRPILRKNAPQSLLGLALEYWTHMALLAALILIIAGRLGSKLGLSGLFSDPPTPDPRLGLKRSRKPDCERKHSRDRGMGAAFWGAIGATLLITQVWVIVYFSEVIEQAEHFQQAHFAPASPFSSIDLMTHFTTVGSGFWDHGDLLQFLRIVWPPFLVLLLLAEILPAPYPGQEDRRRWDSRGEILRFVLGIITAMAVVYVAVKLGALMHVWIEGLWLQAYEWKAVVSRSPVGRFVPLIHHEWLLKGLERNVKVAIVGSITTFLMVIPIFYWTITRLFYRRLSPGLGICMVFSYGLQLYFALGVVLGMAPTSLQATVLLGLLAWSVIANSNPYKYRFPNMLAYYASKDSLVNVKKLAEPLTQPGSHFGLLDNTEVLENWKARTAVKIDDHHEALPRLILIATTGGAYRASFWTTVVLDELEDKVEGFSRNVRLITGASGGMVGAAYYVASINQAGLTKRVTDLLCDESELDSLTSVVRYLVATDLPRALSRSPQDHDRGVELERLWKTLAVTFEEMKDGERQGWRPSLIVSPMIVEAGRRLLISNLDLVKLTETGARENKSEPANGKTSAEKVAARLYSRSAAEFFRIFPKVRKDFRLQTAIRMSATFPFASPAVNLPSDPPCRVVDAGYYDNYGVDLASSWAYENADWIRENTSGVALVQIRASPCEAETLAYLAYDGVKHESAATWLIGKIRTSLEWLTSPCEGALSARNWSMRFRNASQIRVLDDLLNEPGQPRFFETFVFENLAPFAMNWFITEEDISHMRRSMGVPKSEVFRGPVAADSNKEKSGTKASARAEADTTGDPAGKSGSTEAPTKMAEALTKMRKDAKSANIKNKEDLIRWWNSPPVVREISSPQPTHFEEAVGQEA